LHKFKKYATINYGKSKAELFCLKTIKRRELCRVAGSVFEKQGDFIHA
jgi:hypothetical protein